MRICAISDTHSHHRKLTIPECDVLVHSGDITLRGELDIVKDFSDWLKDVPAKHKLVIFGNHEIDFRVGPKRDAAIGFVRQAGAHYLEHSGVKIDGVRFWGSPASPWFRDREWNYRRGADIESVWRQILPDTNVLITHGPPYGIMDETGYKLSGYIEKVGCQDLLRRVGELSELRAHVFGHIHEGYGTEKHVVGYKNSNEVLFVNASSCTASYKPINAPIVFEVMESVARVEGA